MKHQLCLIRAVVRIYFYFNFDNLWHAIHLKSKHKMCEYGISCESRESNWIGLNAILKWTRRKIMNSIHSAVQTVDITKFTLKMVDCHQKRILFLHFRCRFVYRESDCLLHFALTKYWFNTRIASSTVWTICLINSRDQNKWKMFSLFVDAKKYWKNKWKFVDFDMKIFLHSICSFDMKI